MPMRGYGGRPVASLLVLLLAATPSGGGTSFAAPYPVFQTCSRPVPTAGRRSAGRQARRSTKYHLRSLRRPPHQPGAAAGHGPRARPLRLQRAAADHPWPGSTCWARGDPGERRCGWGPAYPDFGRGRHVRCLGDPAERPGGAGEHRGGGRARRHCAGCAEDYRLSGYTIR